MSEHPPHGLAAPYPPDGRAGSAPAGAPGRHPKVARRAVGLAVDVARSALIALLVFALACGVVGVVMTTDVARPLVGGQATQGHGPYEELFGAAASSLGALCSFTFFSWLVFFTARRKAGRPASARMPIVVGLLLSGATWGYSFYAARQVKSDDDREYAAAVALRDRQNGELVALFAAYQQEQATARLEGVAELGNGGSKEAIGLAKQRLAALGRAVTALQSGFDGAHARFRHEIEALEILDRHKRTMLEGFDLKARKRANRVRAYCAAERARVATGDQILAFAATRSGTTRGPTRELDRLLERLRAAAEKAEQLAAELQAAT